MVHIGIQIMSNVTPLWVSVFCTSPGPVLICKSFIPSKWRNRFALFRAFLSDQHVTVQCCPTNEQEHAGPSAAWPTSAYPLLALWTNFWAGTISTIAFEGSASKSLQIQGRVIPVWYCLINLISEYSPLLDPLAAIWTGSDAGVTTEDREDKK